MSLDGCLHVETRYERKVQSFYDVVTFPTRYSSGASDTTLSSRLWRWRVSKSPVVEKSSELTKRMNNKTGETPVELHDFDSLVRRKSAPSTELSEGTLSQVAFDNLPPVSGLSSSNQSIDSSELRRLNALMTCSLNYLRRIPCSGIMMALVASFFSTVSHFSVKLIPNVNSFVLVIFT